MYKPIAGSLALMVLFAPPLSSSARAASDAELSDIRQEMKLLRDSYEAQKQQYEQRMKSLEERLQKAESRAADAEAKAAAAQGAAQEAATAAHAPGGRVPGTDAAGPAAAAPAEAPAASGAAATSTAFNPAISLIMNGTYANEKQDSGAYRITGFLSNEDAIAGNRLPPRRGFGLGESELFLAANVDHVFSGGLNLALEPDNTVSVEEAFFQTQGLGYGLTLKGGRFFSALGYQNSVHAHAWDFVDPSLVQNAFLGGNYGDDGLQLNWVAPVSPVLLEFGGEIGRGSQPPAVDRNKNGVGSTVAYAHLGGDAGTGGSYRVGVSALRTSTGAGGTTVADLDQRTGVVNRFGGDIAVNGIDLVYKWAPNGDYYYTNVKLVAEWFQMKRDGTLFYDVNGLDRPSGFTSTQSGWYVQGSWQFHPYWRVGLRYDRLDPGSMDAGLNAAAGVVATSYAPTRVSTMIDWNPSEFSRIRLQYSQDKSREGIVDNQWFLQYIYSLGTHGAHKF